jgi:hypothetical protein
MKDTDSAFPVMDSYVSLETGNSRLDCIAGGMTIPQYAAIHLKVLVYMRLEPYEGKLSRMVLRREGAEQSALTQPTTIAG